MLGAEGGGGDALPDGEDKVDGDGKAGGHVLEDESLMLQLMELHEREHRPLGRCTSSKVGFSSPRPFKPQAQTQHQWRRTRHRHHT